MMNETSSGKQTRRWLVLLLGLIVVGLVVVLLWPEQRPSATPPSSLAAMPAPSVAVVHFNQATADLTQLTTLWQTFAAATADFDPPLDTPLQTLPQHLAALNISLAADVRPWLGQTVSLSLLSWGDATTTAAWVLAADSVDEAAADGFVDKVNAGEWSAVRSDNLVLIGSSETAVQQALTTLSGESIATDAVYQEAIASLPADHPFTIFVPGERVPSLVEQVWASTSLSNTIPLPQLLPSDGLQSLALALTPTATGLQIDSTRLYAPAAPAVWLAEPQTHHLAPANTLAYLAVGGLDRLWASYLQTLSTNPDQADALEAIALLGDQFGLDPNRDLFPLLDGETAVILTPSRSGPAAQLLRLNLGGTLVASTSDPDTLAANLAGFTTAISNPQLGVATVAATAVNDIPLTQIETSLLPGISFVYGVGHEALLLSTSAESVGELSGVNGRSLADAPDYQAAQTAIGQPPMLFIKVNELVEVFGSSAFMLAQAQEFTRETAVLQPLHILAASSSVSQNMVQNKVILVIEANE
ncbi:MAG: DUF3352 domain-containing protein [Ardenticatenaceae bacterium]|nr:DUF3352 domain-containing protein [Ardenticatenaceae bacterium]